MKSSIFVIALILLALQAPLVHSEGAYSNGGGGPGDPGDEWIVPGCSRITGTANVTFTDDGAVSLAKTAPLTGTVYTPGLVALDEANVLVAAVLEQDVSILRSEDAGCSWHLLAAVPVTDLLLLKPASDGVVYGYARGRTYVVRISGEEVTLMNAPDQVYGLAVDPADPMHIRFGGPDCRIYESNDGGQNYGLVGGSAGTGSGLFYDFAFAPGNWDVALCGGIGAWRTTDAGQTWLPVEPFDTADIDLVYEFVWSPTDPQRVWARSNLETLGAGYRDILVSDDGGATFGTLVRQGDVAYDQNDVARNVVLTNQPLMVAHPVEDRLYFVYGSYYYNYGTDLFSVDGTGSDLAVVHLDALDGIDSLEFNPADPGVMYLGLEAEDVSLQETGRSAAPSAGLELAASPNPFNPKTTISFRLPRDAEVALDVFDLSGRKVSTLVDGLLEAGDYAIPWNGSGCASGVYLYRLTADGVARSGRMMLIK